MRRILALTLILTLLSTACCAYADTQYSYLYSNAAGKIYLVDTGDGWLYQYFEGNDRMYCQNYEGTDTQITLPTEVDGHPVYITNLSLPFQQIERIDIPEYYETITEELLGGYTYYSVLKHGCVVAIHNKNAYISLTGEASASLNMIMAGYAGSTAQTYAEENDLEFELLSDTMPSEALQGSADTEFAQITDTEMSENDEWRNYIGEWDGDLISVAGNTTGIADASSFILKLTIREDGSGLFSVTLPDVGSSELAMSWEFMNNRMLFWTENEEYMFSIYRTENGRFKTSEEDAAVIQAEFYGTGKSEQSTVTEAAYLEWADQEYGLINGLYSESAGGTGSTLGIHSNVGWYVQTPDWVRAEPNTGTGDGSFTIYIDENLGSSRNGVITVSAQGTETISMNITQAGISMDTGCEHRTWTDLYDTEGTTIFTDITEVAHTYQNPFKRVCNDCDEVILCGLFDPLSEPHSFTDGNVCVCGYDRNSCVHTPTDGSSIYKRTLFEPENAYTHKAVADIFEFTCSKCESTYEETIKRSEDSIETGIPHAWGSDGKCVSDGCGYACEHINYGWQENGKGNSEMIDDKTHRYTFPVIYSCTTCGATWKGEEQSEGKHAMTIVTKYEAQDTVYHKVNIYYACSSNCGMKTLTGSTIAAHIPSTDGQCRACGYDCCRKTTLTWTDTVLDQRNTYDFVFNPAYFCQPATEYNHDLAILSFAMVLAVQSDGSLNEEIMNRVYTDFGFHTSANEVYSTYKGDGINNVACTMSWRYIEDEGVTYKLVAVNTRGGNYGTEWVSNFDVGSGTMHRGFALAASKLKECIEKFCEENDIDLYNENVKIWITGFSRSAAVSNYVAQWLNTEYKQSGKSNDDIYVYTFATPNNTKANGKDLKTGCENIFNIVSPDDLVPRVPLDEWEFSRFGVTLYLPQYGTKEASHMMTKLKDITGGYYHKKGETGYRTFQNWSKQSEAVDACCKWVASAIKHDANFDKEYQAILADIASVIWDADIQGSIDARGEVLDKYNAILSTTIGIGVCKTIINVLGNEITPGFGVYMIKLIEYYEDVADELSIEPDYFDTVLDQYADFFSKLGEEFIKLSSDEKDMITELFTGFDLDTLVFYGTAAWSQKVSLTGDAHETYDSIMDELNQFVNFFGHITCTHRMETYLAWLLSNDAETLFGE